jgi:hypothetical protein
MWIFQKDSFLSVVSDRDDKDRLLVRARLPGHIEASFPDAVVFTSDVSDYKYRTLIPREQVATVIAKQLTGIQYNNFKAFVTDRLLHTAYFKVWQVMHALQR